MQRLHKGHKTDRSKQMVLEGANEGQITNQMLTIIKDKNTFEVALL
jgi:hypothetical protein